MDQDRDFDCKLIARHIHQNSRTPKLTDERGSAKPLWKQQQLFVGIKSLRFGMRYDTMN